MVSRPPNSYMDSPLRARGSGRLGLDCSHISGPFVRISYPLALMESARLLLIKIAAFSRPLSLPGPEGAGPTCLAINGTPKQSREVKPSLCQLRQLLLS